MRIWITNTAENQPWQSEGLDENAFDFSTGAEATFRMKIQGKLLDHEEDDGLSASDSEDEAEEEGNKTTDAMDHDGPSANGPTTGKTASPGTPVRTKLSHFFKSITIEFDRAKFVQPDGVNQIEWKKAMTPPNSATLPPSADFDLLEFERKSDENINCTINLVRDEIPERFRLSKQLAEVLDTQEDDRAGVVMGLWEYVKAMGLQEDEERRGIRCDDRLRAVSLPPDLSRHVQL
jgi:SWI/SNF-related matrix-associated actin-dependent regulator of chromatin subfamily D